MIHVQPTRQERNKKQKPTDEELGCSLIDDPPKLPEFDETTSGITASIDENSTPFDVFFNFFPESLVKLFKSETNKYAKTMTDKLRRTNRLKKNSVWGKWVTVKLHEVYTLSPLSFTWPIIICKKRHSQRQMKGIGFCYPSKLSHL